MNRHLHYHHCAIFCLYLCPYHFTTDLRFRILFQGVLFVCMYVCFMYAREQFMNRIHLFIYLIVQYFFFQYHLFARKWFVLKQCIELFVNKPFSKFSFEIKNSPNSTYLKPLSHKVTQYGWQENGGGHSPKC